MKLIRLSTALASVLILLVCAASASADIRYASPDGSGSACTAIAPCGILTAVNSAPASSEVILGPGTYGSVGAPISTQLTGGADINLHGQVGAPRPVIYSSATWGIWPNDTAAPGPWISDLELRKVGGAYGILGREGGVIERVKSVASSGTACSAAGIIRNSLCVASGSGSAMLTSIGSSGGTGPGVNVYNVTAIATGTGSALEIVYNAYSATWNIRNSIFFSAATDIAVQAVDGAVATLNLTNSNYREFVPTTSTGGSASVVPTANQAADPQFVNPAAEDYAQAAGSPTVDAGIDDATNGSTDLAGASRTSGARTDIGAFELQVAPPVPVAPSLSKFKQSKKKFKAAKKGKAFQASSAAKKKSNKGIGTTVSISATAEGSIHFRLFKQVKKMGKKTWTLVKGVETVTAAPGTNKFWFSGRWKSKKLKAGTYQLRGTPTIKGNTIKGTKGDEPGTVRGPTSTVAK